MRFFSVLALAAGASTAATGLAVRSDDKCMKEADVDYLVDAYKSILTQWEPSKANFLADEGFFDYSDSINTVAELPTGFPIFPNKTAFVEHQNQAPDNLPLAIVEVGPWNCNKITVIWSVTFTKVPGNPPLPVRGIAVIEGSYDNDEKKWHIQSLKVEFNSINYYKNTGGICSRSPPPVLR